ncbi:LemA family protein [Candidatus Woesebacteria bacterium]|nr:LemA family protein [Candidatus Woesebacteria bacterium]
MELIVLGLLSVFFVVFNYNKLVSSKQNVKEAWSGIDVQLKRRHDLIPSLVDTVKGYAKHESALFNHIAAERTKAIAFKGDDREAIAAVESEITQSMKSLFVVAEAYPALKANENFLSLQQQLGETEDQIASARRIYNSNVADMNTLIESFPSNILASILSFRKAEYFEDVGREKEVKITI